MYHGVGKPPDKGLTGFELIELCEKLGNLT